MGRGEFSTLHFCPLNKIGFGGRCFSAPAGYAADMATKPAPAQPQAHDDDEAAYLASVDRGLADVKAGRTVSYERVRRWLLSWGTENELPPPKWP